jgi:hypothetical protein
MITQSGVFASIRTGVLESTKTGHKLPVVTGRFMTMNRQNEVRESLGENLYFRRIGESPDAYI